MTGCIRLATTMEVSCKAYLLQLVRGATISATMVVIHHQALGAALAVIAILETATTQPQQSAMAAVVTVLPHLLVLTPAAVIDQCIRPTAVDP